MKARPLHRAVTIRPARNMAPLPLHRLTLSSRKALPTKSPLTTVPEADAWIESMLSNEVMLLLLSSRRLLSVCLLGIA